MDNLFKIKCKNERNRCSEISLYGDFENHEKNCQFELVHCLNQGCCEWLIKLDIKHHRDDLCLFALEICKFCLKDVYKHSAATHILSDCQEVVLECDLCRNQMAKRQLMYHKDYECQEAVSTCINYPQCTQKFVRKHLDEHLRVMCAYKLVLCDKVCNLALPRGILKDHNCATSLKAVYLKIK